MTVKYLHRAWWEGLCLLWYKICVSSLHTKRQCKFDRFFIFGFFDSHLTFQKTLGSELFVETFLQAILSSRSLKVPPPFMFHPPPSASAKGLLLAEATASGGSKRHLRATRPFPVRITKMGSAGCLSLWPLSICSSDTAQHTPSSPKWWFLPICERREPPPFHTFSGFPGASEQLLKLRSPDWQPLEIA